MKRRFISGLLAGMMAVSLLAGLPEPVKVSAKTVSGLENANFNFEEGITGWETTGTVTEETSGAQGGSKYVHLEAGASITTTIKNGRKKRKAYGVRNRRTRLGCFAGCI